jgi:hypothetical protein
MTDKTDLSTLCKRYIETAFENGKVNFSGINQEFYEHRGGVLFPRSFMDFIDFFKVIFNTDFFCIVYKHKEIYQEILSLQSLFCNLVEMLGSIRSVMLLNRQNLITVYMISNNEAIDEKRLNELRSFIKQITSKEEIEKQCMFFRMHQLASVSLGQISSYLYENLKLNKYEDEENIIEEFLLSIITLKEYFIKQERLWKKYTKAIEILNEISLLFENKTPETKS